MHRRKKELLTREQIVEDIRNAMRVSVPIRKKEYKTQRLIGLIGGVAAAILFFFYPYAVIYIILGVCFATIVGSFLFVAIRAVYRKKKIRAVRIEDYRIGTELLSGKDCERFRQRVTRYHYKTVIHLILRFQGEEWRVPENVYRHSTEYRDTPWFTFDSAEVGDEFIVVRKKDTNAIVMAYHCDLFEQDFS